MTLIRALPLLLTGLVSTSVAADPGDWEIGLRFDGNLADGEPANDILGGTLLARYILNDDWSIGGSYSTSTFDFERPSSALNIQSIAVVDSTVDSSMVAVWAERRYNEQNRGAYWFWSIGAGINSLDAGIASGNVVGGASYMISTDIDNEAVLFATVGRRHNLTDYLSVGYGIRLANHFGDWTSTDRVSGLSAKINDSYLVHGGFFSINYRF